MEKYLWRLLTAVFCIVSAIGLYLLDWIFSGGSSALVAYVVLFLVLIGITKGILVIIDYRREHEDETEE